MTFFTWSFLLLLIVTFIAYYTVPGNRQWGVLLLSGCAFYLLAGGIKAFALLTATALITFFTGLSMQKTADEGKELAAAAPDRQQRSAVKERTKKTLKRKMWAGAAADLLILGYSKYLNFLVAQFAGLFGMEPVPFLRVIVPLGISFYTFQSVGYLADINLGRARAQKNFLKFFLFTSFFPYVVQGPINKYGDLAEQLYAARRYDHENTVRGVARMLCGYLKKMVIADRAGVLVNEVFSHYAEKDYRGFTVLLAVLVYGVQIYADFSGGIDVTMGVCRCLGIRLEENFRQPFFSGSVTEFWQRWHISLGTWMKDYVFYPLALSKPFGRLGKKCSKAFGPAVGKLIAPTLASFIVFVLVGFWHEASWKYIVYGVYHAVLVSSASLLEPLYARTREKLHINAESAWWKGFRMLRTLLLCTVGRYLTRSRDLSTALQLMERTLSPAGGTDLFSLGLDKANFFFLLVSIAVLFAADAWEARKGPLAEKIAGRNVCVRLCAYCAAILILLLFGWYGKGFEAAGFIYQEF